MERIWEGEDWAVRVQRVTGSEDMYRGKREERERGG